MAGNEHALNLYLKFGFEREGTRVKGVRLSSGYRDEHIMGKWLDPRIRSSVGGRVRRVVLFLLCPGLQILRQLIEL
jgi:hypothetical protein